MLTSITILVSPQPAFTIDFDGVRFDAIHRGRTDLGQHADVMGEFAVEFKSAVRRVRVK
jgi:hypothetical protein